MEKITSDKQSSMAAKPFEQKQSSLPINTKRLLVTLTLCAICTIIISGTLAFIIVHSLIQNSTTEQSLKTTLHLERYILFNEVMGTSQALGIASQDVKNVVNATTEPDNPKLLTTLENIRSSLDAAIVYIMDKNGLVLASTRYDGNESLTGENYSFRPYFMNAIKGKNSVYPALGVTTNKRGLYYSSPIFASMDTTRPEDITGVIVVKMGLKAVDNFLYRQSDPIALISPEGIVFSSNQSNWLYKSLFPLDESEISEMKRTRQIVSKEDTPPRVVFKTKDRESYYPYNEKKFALAITPFSKDSEFNGWKIAYFQDIQVQFHYTLLGMGIIIIVVIYSLIYVLLCSKQQNKYIEKQQQKFLKDSADTYKSIVDSVSDVIFITDLKTSQIIDVNENIKSVFGYKKGEIFGIDFSSLSSDKFAFTHEKMNEIFERIPKEGPQSIEWQFRKKDSTPFWADIYLNRCFVYGKERILVAVHDITDQHKAAEALLQAKEQALADKANIEHINRQLEAEVQKASVLSREAISANKAKSQFLTVISHEIRTPLNAIVGFTDLLLDADLQEDECTYVKMIHEASEKLEELIINVLDISQIDTGIIEASYASCNVHSMIKDIERLFKPEAERKGLIYENIFDNMIPETIKTDPMRLKQCLINLINNAIKFTPSGKITIHTYLEDYQEAPHITFDIIDTGIGIEEDKHEAIFDMFTQVESSDTRNFEGIGLGLAITKSLVDILSGKLTMISAPGKGSTFTISIPCIVIQKSTSKRFDEVNEHLNTTE